MPIQQKRDVLLIVAFVLICIIAAYAYVQTQKNEIISATKIEIATQEKVLATLATLTSRDGADSVVESIIKDCSLESRARFDTQLGKLATLNKVELAEIEQLFEACGSFFSGRKALMVARLSRELEMYENLVALVGAVDSSSDKELYKTDDWNKLVSLEKDRSQLATTLVEIQRAIITELRKGTPVSSDTLELLMVDGQKNKEKLIERGTEIDALRGEVLHI